MNLHIREVSDFIGGKIIGNDEITFSNVARIEEAKDGDLTFLYLPAYQKYLDSTKASIVLIPPAFIKSRNDITYIEVENPNIALQKIVVRYLTPRIKFSGIDPAASVSTLAFVEKEVSLGKNVVISEKCKIGKGSIILHNSVIMENVEIGENCLIYPNVTIRENCVIGNNVIIHSGTVIGSDGFGYIPDAKGIYTKVPQIGNVVIKDDVEIGSNVSIDRAALGSTVINKGAKLDNLIQIAHNVSIGEHTVISAQSGISGSTKIGNHCILAGQSGLTGHIEISDNVIIGAQSGVSKSIRKPGTYIGRHAKEIKKSLKIESYVDNLPDLAQKVKFLEEQIRILQSKLDQKE